MFSKVPSNTKPFYDFLDAVHLKNPGSSHRSGCLEQIGENDATRGWFQPQSLSQDAPGLCL